MLISTVQLEPPSRNLGSNEQTDANNLGNLGVSQCRIIVGHRNLGRVLVPHVMGQWNKDTYPLNWHNSRQLWAAGLGEQRVTLADVHAECVRYQGKEAKYGTQYWKSNQELDWANPQAVSAHFQMCQITWDNKGLAILVQYEFREMSMSHYPWDIGFRERDSVSLCFRHWRQEKNSRSHVLGLKRLGKPSNWCKFASKVATWSWTSCMYILIYSWLQWCFSRLRRTCRSRRRPISH